jgi:hypothetical protein
MNMPAALTLDQKKARAEAGLAINKPQSTERKRNVFNGTEGKLKVNNQIEGYHLYIFNDTPGRINAALDNGYEFVSPNEVGGVSENVVSRNTDLGDKVRYLVGQVDGEPLYAYLMKIKQEWWDEDQSSLQTKNNVIDAAIQSGQNVKGDAGKFYGGGISIKT